MKVAAYQAPLLPANSNDALSLIRKQIKHCETEGINILCCSEAILGGLADYARNPTEFAIPTSHGQLEAALARLASDTVTTIIGFTELAKRGELYNAAAVFHQGKVTGVYRKLYPAINHSIYEPGHDIPVFKIDGLTFGIVICNDSNYPEPARRIGQQGATALFIPTNNALPKARACIELVTEAKNADIARATENKIWVIRADVAGRTDELVSYGSSGIVDPNGKVVQSARQLSDDLIFAEINIAPRAKRRSSFAS